MLYYFTLYLSILKKKLEALATYKNPALAGKIFCLRGAGEKARLLDT